MKITDVNPSRRCGGEDRLVILPQAETLLVFDDYSEEENQEESNWLRYTDIYLCLLHSCGHTCLHTGTHICR